jgi:hypothetical protein
MSDTEKLAQLLDECERAFVRHEYTTYELAEWLLAHGVSVGTAVGAPRVPPDAIAKLRAALKPFTEVGWTNLGGSDHYGELVTVSVLIGDLARARTAYYAGEDA